MKHKNSELEEMIKKLEESIFKHQEIVLKKKLLLKELQKMVENYSNN